MIVEGWKEDRTREEVSVPHAVRLFAGGTMWWKVSQVGSQNKSISYLLYVTHVELNLHLWLGLLGKENISIKLAWLCREEKADIKMPLRSPFHLLQKTVHSLPFHHVMIYITSVIFKMAPKCCFFFFCSKFAFVICICKQSLCLPIPRGRAAVEARQHQCLCWLRSTSLPLLQKPRK